MMKRFSSAGKPSTLREVALRAQVSVATASNALNGTGRVAEPTRRRVADAAEALGFRPSLAARALKGVGGRLMVLLTDGFAGPWYAEVLEGLQRPLKDAGYAVVALTIQDESLALCRALADDGLVRGLAVLNAGAVAGADLRDAALRVPAAVFDAPAAWEGCRRFGVENAAGVEALTDHLWGAGCRDYLWLGGPSATSPDAAARQEAFSGALEVRGLEPARRRVVPAGFGPAEARRALTRVLETGPAPRAVCAVSDEAAFGALQALGAAGLRVPADVAVTGFDGLEASAWTSPPLTTASWDRRALGRAMAAHLLDPGGPASDLLLPTELVLRESSRLPTNRTSKRKEL